MNVRDGKRLPRQIRGRSFVTWFDVAWDKGYARGEKTGYAAGWRDAQESRNADELRELEGMGKDIFKESKR